MIVINDYRMIIISFVAVLILSYGALFINDKEEVREDVVEYNKCYTILTGCSVNCGNIVPFDEPKSYDECLKRCNLKFHDCDLNRKTKQYE